VQDVRDAHAMGLFGGVLLPTSTGAHPYYHDYARYEPLWNVCEELGMPLHTHSGWSPDYGDVPAATPMYISEVDMWAQRPFKALLWSGVFERHPELKLVFTETGCGWILETLRVLDFKIDNPIFAHFTKNLSLRPREYFERQCYIGASFMYPHEGVDRHRIGVEKLMYGTDYPHIEGTWPNTMTELRKTFGTYAEDEIRGAPIDALACELRHYLAVMDDRAGDELRKKGDEQAVMQKLVLLRFALIHVGEVRDLLEREEGYRQR